MSSQESPTSRSASVQLAALWEKPLVANSGGEAILLVRIVATKQPAGTTARRAPIDVGFVLDRSGSMAGEKLALVKQAVDVAISQLHEDDGAALVVYDNQIEVLQPLAAATPRLKTALRLGLQGVDPRGSTNLGGGWLAGCQALSGDSFGGRIRRVLLLTDGLANVGMVDPAELTHHAGELRKRGIGTTTLGVGLDFDEFLLSGMAEAGGGNFQFIEQPTQLPAFFARELGELLTVVASGLKLSLTMPSGVRAKLINRYPVERTGKRLDIAVGDLAAGSELNLIFQLSIKPGAIGTAHHLTLGAIWADPSRDARQATELQPAPLLLAEPAIVAATASDPIVAEQSALLRAAAARREALQLDRAGDYAASRQRMQQATVMLRAAPATADILSELETTEQYAASPIDSAYSEPVRKQALYAAHRRERGKGSE